MLKKIMKFEILYNLKKPFTYLFFIMMIVQGIWYATGTHDYHGNSNTLMNASVVFYQNLSITGIFLIIIAAIVSAGALARDLELKTAESMYPGILNDKKFFAGKYFGVLTVNFIIALGYPLGMLLLPYVGAGAPGQFGAVPWGQLLHGFVIFSIPNLLFIVTFAVFLVVFFRKGGIAYIGSFCVMMMVMIPYSMREQTSYPLLLQMIDPFGYSIVLEIIDGMSIAQRNTAYLPVSGGLLLNRVIWISISIVMFIASFIRFDFKYFIARPSKKKTVIEGDFKETHVLRNKSISFTPVFSRGSFFSKAFRFAWMDFKGMARTPFFRFVMVFLCTCFLLNNFCWTSEYYITTSHLPLTSVMTFVRIIMMVMTFLFIILFSGELLFKDRGSGVWQITDAMPTPSWVFILSRFFTLAGVVFLISTLMLATGLIAQLCGGFTDIEWGLYLKDFYSSRFGWITSMQVVCMAFFIGSVFGDRLKGHVLSIAVFIFTMVSLEFGMIDQLRFGFPFVPGIEQYSEMNGYGVFDTALPWYGGAWSTLSVIFILLTVLFWNRGTDRTLKERLNVVKGKLTPVSVSVLLFCIFLFGIFEYGIHDNMIVKAEYQTEDQENAEAAAYERKYNKYAEKIQPKISDFILNVDIYPDERKAVYKSILTLKNKSNVLIRKLHIDRKKFLTIKTVNCGNRKLKIEEDDETLRHSIYSLSRPLKPGESMDLVVHGKLHYLGFHQNDPQADLTYNGTFLGIDLLPYFGYDEERELDNNRDRLEQGLVLIESRMDSIDNLFSRSNAVQSDQADLMSWNIVVSTCADQEVAGPGELVKAWREKGRNYFRYRSEKSGPMNFKLISARYKRKEFTSDNTRVSIYYHPAHTYNLECIQEAAQKAMKWLSGKMGKYPYSSMRIAEKTFYDDDFVTFSNVTAVSEKHGWTADISKPEDKQYIFYTIARELAKQWVESRVLAANVQGAEIFTESIPEYYALSFMDECFGHKEAVKWLDENYKDYQEGKGKEAIAERPLLNVDEAAYVSREKGGLALYALAQQHGVDKFNTWLNRWLVQSSKESKNRFVTSRDFYIDMKKELPVCLYPFADECFKERIQYQMSLTHASVKNDLITLNITAARGIMDGLGNLTGKSLKSLLEVGFTDKNGKLIATEKIAVRSGTHTYSLHSSVKPDRIVLDPHYWYLIGDRERSVRTVD